MLTLTLLALTRLLPELYQLPSLLVHTAILKAVHPDKNGEEFTDAFQTLNNSYQRMLLILIERKSKKTMTEKKVILKTT